MRRNHFNFPNLKFGNRDNSYILWFVVISLIGCTTFIGDDYEGTWKSEKGERVRILKVDELTYDVDAKTSKGLKDKNISGKYTFLKEEGALNKESHDIFMKIANEKLYLNKNNENGLFYTKIDPSDLAELYPVVTRPSFEGEWVYENYSTTVIIVHVVDELFDVKFFGVSNPEEEAKLWNGSYYYNPEKNSLEKVINSTFKLEIFYSKNHQLYILDEFLKRNKPIIDSLDNYQPAGAPKRNGIQGIQPL